MVNFKKGKENSLSKSVIPLITSPFAVFTLSTLTRQFPPEKTLTTLPSGQLNPGDIFLNHQKNVILCLILFSFHLLRLFNWGNHSLTHLFQKWFRISCTLHHLLFGLKPVESSTSSGAKFPLKDS